MRRGLGGHVSRSSTAANVDNAVCKCCWHLASSRSFFHERAPVGVKRRPTTDELGGSWAPAIQARALRSQVAAQHEIVDALSEAYPSVDDLELGALVGAFLGAVAGSFQQLSSVSDVDERERRVRGVVRKVLLTRDA